MKYVTNQSRAKTELGPTTLAAQPCWSLSQYIGVGFQKCSAFPAGCNVMHSLAGWIQAICTSDGVDANYDVSKVKGETC